LKKMRKYKFSYDADNDALFIYHPRSRSKGGVECGQMIIDFNNKKEFVGIQLIGASGIIKDLLGEKQSVDEVLSNLIDCRISEQRRGNMLLLRIVLSSKKKEIAPVLLIPSILESSPALAFA